MNDLPTFQNTMLLNTVTVPPMTQVTVRVSKPAVGLCFIQNYARPAMRHFRLMAQGVMAVIPHLPLTVCVNSFQDKPVHAPKHTALGIALILRAQIMTVGPASPGAAEVEEREEDGNEGTPNKDNRKTSEDEVSVGF